MPKAGVTHDITIASVGGAPRGFMLARDARGRRGYLVRDAQTIAPRTLTQGELTEAEFPPELVMYWSQENWRGGLGGQVHRLDPDRAAKLVKMEGTLSGALRLAPQLTATTDDTAPASYKPSGFAVVGTEVWSFQGGDVYYHTWGGTQWTKGTRPRQYSVVYRNGVEYNGKTFAPALIISAYGKGDITLSADDPWYYIYKAGADTNWTTTSWATRKVPKYLAKMRDASESDIIVGANFAQITVGSQFTTATGGLADTTEPPFGLSVVDADAAPAPPFHFLMNNEIFYCDSKNTVADLLNVPAGGRAAFGTNQQTHGADGLKQFQYSSISPHQIRTTSDPTAEGSWSGAIDIGESDSKITGLVSDDNRVLVLKTNGVWAYYSDGTVTHITPEFEKSAHPDNFRAAHMWNGRLLLPLGAGGMMEMANDVLRDVSLKLYAPDEPYIHGRVVALASEPTRLFALVQDETASAYNLLMAEWAQVQGSSDYRWHHVGAIPYATSATSGHATLFAEGIPSGSYIHHRLWAGVESGGSNLLPYFLPMESDSGHGFTNDGLGTTHDSGATVNESLSDSDTTLTVSDGTNFPSDSVIKIGSEILTVSAISGNDLTVQRGMFGSTAASHSSSTAVSIVDAPEVRFTAWDGNLPNVSKTIASLDVSSLNLGSGGRQFTFLYKLDNGPWMNDLPNDGVVETNPVQTLTFPDGTTAKVLELRAFPALTSVGSIGPVLTRFRVAATLRPPDLKLLPVQITLADGLTLLNGARGGSPKTGLSQLRAWNSQAAEVVITDPEGTEHCMVFLPGTLTVQETAREGVRRSEYTVSFTLAEV